MDFEINVYKDCDTKHLPVKKIKAIVEKVLTGEAIGKGKVSVIFTDNKKIKALNKAHLSHNYPTDVLSFQIGDDCIDGEIYISAEMARKQAQQYKVSLQNELLRLAAHGTLHLVGYDDSNYNMRRSIRRLENKYISLFYKGYVEHVRANY